MAKYRYKIGDKIHLVQTNDGWVGLYVNGKQLSNSDTSSIYYWFDILGIPYTSADEDEYPEAQSEYGFNFKKVRLDD